MRPEDTIMAAAMVAAAEHHQTHGRGGLTRVAVDGVKCQSVDGFTDLPMAARQQIAEDIEADGGTNLWFASTADGRLDVFRVKTETCIAALRAASEEDAPAVANVASQ